MPDTSVHRERELKFEVDDDFEVPDVADLAGSGDADTVEHGTIALSSTYHDSPGLDLLAHGVTLRRRTGDEDTGWQLKIPADGARNELQLPLSDGGVPAELSGLLAGIVRARDLTAVATLDTERRVTRVRRAGGLVVEIADDRVIATTGGRTCAQWREVEIELGPAGDEQSLAAFAERLAGSGATSSPHPSKLGRALGRGPQAPAGAAGRLLGTQLRASSRLLVGGDIALRSEPGSPLFDGDGATVERTRSHVRRLRAVLRVFADVLPGGFTGADGGDSGGGTVARALDAELSWYGHLLGDVTDRRQVRDRLRDAIAQLPAGLVPAGAGDELDRALLAEQEQARAAVGAALATNRYRRMLGAVAGLVDGDPVVPGTGLPALRELVDDAARTAVRRLRRAAEAPDPDVLHRARRAVTRARLAAELLAGDDKHPARNRRRLDRLREIGVVLDAHRDAVVAATVLRRPEPGADAFVQGLLYARELDLAAAAARQAVTLPLPD